MDMETQRFGFTDFFNTVPKCISSSYSNPLTDLETGLAINSLVQDDKIQLLNFLKRLFVSNSLNRADDQTAVVSKLLRFCCLFDSIHCARSLVDWELGQAAMVNEVNKLSGMSAIHVAAESHAARCVQMLLKKRARTDIRSKDGHRLLALQLSVSSSSMDVTWNLDEYSLEDLIVMLGEKDWTTVKLLSEKTKEVEEVANANAVGGRIVAFAALLVVAADKVNESILVLHNSDLGVKEKTTIFECLIRGASSLGRETTTLRTVKRNCTPSKGESAEKRKLLLCEIELLQLYDGVAHGRHTGKKVASTLTLATQVTLKISITEDAKTEEMSWAGELLHGQLKTCSNESQARVITSFGEKNKPKWLRTFKKWLPCFLKDEYKNPIEEEYAVSSLKSDFKAAFGLELDHASLGYPKLSDFMTTYPNLCHGKAGTISKNGWPNHVVLLPSLPKRKARVLQSFTTQSLSSPSNSASDSNDCDFNGSKSPQEFQSVSNEYAGFTFSTIEEKPSHDIPAQRDTPTRVNSASMNASNIDYSRIFPSLKPRFFSDNGNDGGSGGNNNGGGSALEESEEKKLKPLPRHAVLEALARRRKNRSMFFLREFDFYDDYNASLNQVKCFGCSQRQMRWANFPCQHLLWCNDCRIEAVQAADGNEHKCVICDRKVEQMNSVPSNRDYQHFTECLSDPEAFPPFDASRIRSLKKRNRR